MENPMDITKIGHGENPDAVKAIIEVPLNSMIKYEIDKDSGAVEVDRVLYSAMHYPANYGFVANTLSDDGDPADILVLCDYPLQAGSYIKCRLVGVLMTEDESGGDEKLIAVPTEKIDPTYAKIQDLSDVPEHTLNRIKNDLRATGEREINAALIGELVMKTLKELDEVAYVRFASVYRSFQDIEEFRKELDKLQKPES